MTRDGKGMGGGATGQHGAKNAGPESNLESMDESDLSADIMGRNSLHGNSQRNFPNERQEQAEYRPETDDLIESFEKLDKETRAQRDLGKGNRHSPDHPFNRTDKGES